MEGNGEGITAMVFRLTGKVLNSWHLVSRVLERCLMCAAPLKSGKKVTILFMKCILHTRLWNRVKDKSVPLKP